MLVYQRVLHVLGCVGEASMDIQPGTRIGRIWRLAESRLDV